MLRSLITSLTIGSALVMTNPPESHGQELEAVLEAAAIDIDGAKSPEALPYWLKMQWFFHFYELNWEQVKGLSPNDEAILRRFAGLNEARLTEEYADYVQTISPVCSDLDRLPVTEIADRIERLTEEWQERKSARYRNVLATLSDEGRKIVEDFVAREIAPKTSFSSADARLIAARAPDYYIDGIRRLCKSMLTGETPPLPSSDSVSEAPSSTTSSSATMVITNTP